ncbi:hypothetical protein B0H16DRAFT_1467796 [Mycena metata]|uniref:Uncharacterized protein n=1 Tax=Mycena metata TaxID=1033252 RepID=A0AAD7I2V2_9AGAR|nr:hypothetical protein B0H16DRAFT_1467796 [Mycena metata]
MFSSTVMQQTINHPQRKKKKRRSLLPRPTPRPPIPPQEPRRLRHHSVPTPQESARRTDAYINPEAEASWQDAFSTLPDIVLQWAAGTLPTGDESDDAKDCEMPDLESDNAEDYTPVVTTSAELIERRNYLAMWREQDAADRLQSRADGIRWRREVREERALDAYQTDGEAAETSWRTAGPPPRRPRVRIEDTLTPARRDARHEQFREHRARHEARRLEDARERARHEARQLEEERERERDAQLPGLRRVIVDAMRPWERQEFLRGEREQEMREMREEGRARRFDDFDTIDYVE